MTRLEAEIAARVWKEAAEVLSKAFENLKVTAPTNAAYSMVMGIYKGRAVELRSMAKSFPQEPYR